MGDDVGMVMEMESLTVANVANYYFKCADGDGGRCETMIRHRFGWTSSHFTSQPSDAFKAKAPR